MKGFYILALIAIILAVLAYMALKDTDSDLRRRHEFLLNTVETMEERLKGVLDPLKRLRAEKATIRLDKEYSRLTTRVSQSRRKLNAALHSVETLEESTRKTTAESLERLRQELDGLLMETSMFTARVDVIDAFIVAMKPLRTDIMRLLQDIHRLAAQREGSSPPLPDALKNRVDKITESTQSTVKLADDTLMWIWKDLDQGKVYAERRISELKTCIPTLQTLLNDLKEQ